jgi:hypothetical protein
MRNWMSNISDDLLGRLGRSDQPFPASSFQGSASDFASRFPTPAAPRREPIFIPTHTRPAPNAYADAGTIAHLKFGR